MSNFFGFGSILYPLRKSHRIMQTGYQWYKKSGKQLFSHELSQFEANLQLLDQALLRKDRIEANMYARKVEDFCQAHFKKGWVDYLLEIVLAVVIALFVAIIIRQTWFELYEIPTGSMRPTFEEQDHLTVTKTAYGINVPLMTKHFYFDPNLVQRTSVIIWSGDGVPFLNNDSTFMGIFPYTKRYIKRCMGKPGDTLYFYGGKIYGFDREGKDLVELRNNPWMTKLDHVPFTSFNGRIAQSQEMSPVLTKQVTFSLFNRPVGRLMQAGKSTDLVSQVFNGKEWVKDRPQAILNPHTTIETYSDFAGIRNFAMARLLNKTQVQNLTNHSLKGMEEGLLYLELYHTPTLADSQSLLITQNGLTIKGFSTLIPLQEKHLKAIMDNMYTARFVVKEGRADRYRQEKNQFTSSSPNFPGIPDGVYEFYYGKGYKIGWGGIASLLPADHPLYSIKVENIQKLFNVGMEVSKIVEPHRPDQLYSPNRYAYFREGNLYLLGGSIFEKEDPILTSFNARELQKQEAATARRPYFAFKDHGPPLKQDGQLDKAFISAFGYKIPDNHYLALGDNHAMSQDSREFGPIPQDSLQGAPSLIIWPSGPRWGIPNMKPYPLLNLPRLIVWSIAALILGMAYAIHRYRMQQPIFKKIEEDFSKKKAV